MNVYVDTNFIICAHKESADYKASLLGAIASGAVTVVLSTPHWIDMAGNTVDIQRRSQAAFCDQLKPMWLLERFAIQRREVAFTFFHFLGTVKDPVIVNLGSLTKDLVGQAAVQSVAAFVEVVRNSPKLVQTMKAVQHQAAANVGAFRAGKITCKVKQKVNRAMFELALPSTTPLGLSYDISTKRTYLDQVSLEDHPAMWVEDAITVDGWTQGRNLGQNNFMDMHHAMALPYVDVFVTDDARLRNLIARIGKRAPFRFAEVITKAEFDSRFLGL